MRDFGLICVASILAFSNSLTAQIGKVGPPTTSNPEIGGKSLDEWIKLIEDRDPSTREHAIKMVGFLGPQAKKAVPALIRQLSSGNDLSPLTNAAIAIGVIVPDDPKQVKEATAGLIQLLGSPQAIIRFQAATSIGNLGPGARAATTKLCGLIRDQSTWEVRKAAAYALGRVGRDDLNLPDLKALTALVDGIDDPSKEVRIESLQGLINLGPPTSPQDHLALKQKLESRIKVDRDKFVAIWVRVALLRTDPTSNVDAYIAYIARQLKSSEPGVPADAARGFGALGQYARGRVGELTEALKSPDTNLTIWAAWALGRMGGDAKSALPALNTLLESADSAVKSAAQDAIKDINAPPKR